jgi:hypothetical protein
VTTINLPNDMPRFLSVKDTAARKNCPFSEASLRHLIFYAEPRLLASGETIPGNGLATALLRIGRRVLIDQQLFESWIASHRVAGPE